ncbi:MAG: helix-turn-helix transcriptional regulator [Bacteroidota bacterium]
MSVSNTLIIVLLALGAGQGIIYGSILLRSTSNILANRILATILFFLSYRLVVQILRLFGLGHYDGWYYVMLDFSWIHGPLLYFYVKSHLNPNFTFKRRDLLHFIPFGIQVSFSIFVRLQNLYWDGSRESLSWLGYWGYVVWMNLCTIYFVASVMIIIYTTKSQSLLQNQFEEKTFSEERLHWLKRVLLAFKIYFSLVLIILVVDLIVTGSANFMDYFYFKKFYYYPFFIGISGLTYWLGLEGYKRKDLKRKMTKPRLTPMEQRQLETIAHRLQEAMAEKKWFKDSELTLTELANRIEVKPYLLTKCLNTVVDQKFADYINLLRVEELRNLLKQPENKKFTLLSLAYESGFNSKSSFNRAVKKHLGISPNQLREEP